MEPAAAFSCPECSSTFTARWSLTQHILNSHQKERLYSCDVCLKAFSRKDHLTKHKRVHKIQKQQKEEQKKKRGTTNKQKNRKKERRQKESSDKPERGNNKKRRPDLQLGSSNLDTNELAPKSRTFTAIIGAPFNLIILRENTSPCTTFVGKKEHRGGMINCETSSTDKIQYLKSISVILSSSIIESLKKKKKKVVMSTDFFTLQKTMPESTTRLA